jgi:large subunit ribosomal protein L1
MKKILEKLKKAREDSKKRKFRQTWDFSINLKGVDLKKPEHRFSIDFVLPEGRGKDTKVVIFADAMLAEAKKNADLVITKDDIPSYAKDKKKLKELARNYDWFFGEVSLMAGIGKSFGAVLGTRGKMPKPIPPKVPIKPFVERAKRSTRIAVKSSPVIHIVVGAEDMTDEQIAKNVQAVFNTVKEKLPKGVSSMKSAYIKLTMGKPMKLEVV